MFTKPKKKNGNLKIIGFVIFSVLYLYSSPNHADQDQWGWEPTDDNKSWVCPWQPAPTGATTDVPIAEDCEEPNYQNPQPDKPIVIFISGICDKDDRQNTEGEEGLIYEWAQFRGEGIPGYSENDGVSYGQSCVPDGDDDGNDDCNRGAELGQLILNDSTAWTGNSIPDPVTGWDSISNGEASFYRVPWGCWIGLNAGAVQLAKMIGQIVDKEFGPYAENVANGGGKWNRHARTGRH